MIGIEIPYILNSMNFQILMPYPTFGELIDCSQAWAYVIVIGLHHQLLTPTLH